MAVNYRALYIWALTFILLIFLVIQLDKKIVLNWFVVFLPVWIFDVSAMCYILFHSLRHCRTGTDRLGYSHWRKIFFLFCVLLKALFEVLLCLKLEYMHYLTLYQILLPAWLLLIVSIGELTWRLGKRLGPSGCCCTVDHCGSCNTCSVDCCKSD